MQIHTGPKKMGGEARHVDEKGQKLILRDEDGSCCHHDHHHESDHELGLVDESSL